VSRALVLGGGGLTGIAWETGVLLGLKDEGVDVSEWDLVVGTSAGSIVGSMVLGHPDLEAYYTIQTTEATPLDDLPVRALGGRVGATIMRLGRRRALAWLPAIYLAASISETFVRQRARRARTVTPYPELSPGFRLIAGPNPTLARVGAWSLAARTADEDAFLGVIEEVLEPVAAWPDRLVVSAIDAMTGTTVGIDGRSDVPFFRAVAASCSVPGILPSIRIGGRQYIDGGMASQTHADLAHGHDEVIVIAPLDFGRLGREVEGLRQAGARVTVISPSPASAAAIGRRFALLDPARRARSAVAGREDGRAALTGEAPSTVGLAGLGQALNR
jgi:NTE family protein